MDFSISESDLYEDDEKNLQTKWLTVQILIKRFFKSDVQCWQRQFCLFIKDH